MRHHSSLNCEGEWMNNIPGIYATAVPTILGAAVLCMITLFTLTKGDRRYYWLVIAGLPLSLIVNKLIKIPFIGGIAALTDTPLRLDLNTSWWFLLVIWFNAPLFEEAIKALPIVFLKRRYFLETSIKSLYAGLALGLGFGIGEAAYIAYEIAHSPAYSSLPWYMFTGYAMERLIVTFAHGFLTTLTVLGLQRGGKKLWLGYASAVGLHALINLGPILLALKLIPAAVSSLGTYLAIAAAFMIFERNLRSLRKEGGAQPEEFVYFQR
jgi:uncharacterized membrane protein YhfC